jgi:hypothetical protein
MLPSIEDIVDAFASMSAQEWSVVVGSVMWLVLLWMPLRGIDRRDRIAGATYALWLGTAGFILILAVPRKMSASSYSSDHFFLLLALAAIAFIRWVTRRRVVLEVPLKKETRV